MSTSPATSEVVEQPKTQAVQEEPIYLQAAYIENVFGIKTLEFKHDIVTILEGDNEICKTSAIDAVASVLEGGKKAQLLREGADKGEIVLILSNGAQVRKTITPSGSKLSVTNKDGWEMPKPQTWLDSITDPLRTNPTKFLSASSKDRVKYLLDTVPLSLNDGQREVLKEAGIPANAEESDDLSYLKKSHEEIYNQRTSINRDVNRDKATIEKFLQGVPEGSRDTASTAALYATTCEELKQSETLLSGGLSEIDDRYSERIKSINEDQQKENQELTDEYERRLQELNRWRDDERTRISNAAADLREQELKASNSSKDELRARLQPEIDRLTKEKTVLDERLKESQRIQGVLDNVAELEREVSAGQEKSQRLTHQLEVITQIMHQLTGALPIPGLSIIDGDIALDGIGWQRINLAKRIMIFVEICKLRAGRLKLIILDDLEHLSPNNRMLLLRGIANAGLTVLCSVVTEGPLTIKNLSIN